jgi:hypothetical protein
VRAVCGEVGEGNVTTAVTGKAAGTKARDWENTGVCRSGDSEGWRGWEDSFARATTEEAAFVVAGTKEATPRWTKVIGEAMGG